MDASIEFALWLDLTLGEEAHEQLHQQRHYQTGNVQGGEKDDFGRQQPHGALLAPVYDSFDQGKRNITGSLLTSFSLDTFLFHLLPDGVNGMYLVVGSTCGSEFSYRIDGNRVSWAM